MNEPSALTERAFLVVNFFAFETIFNDKFGKKQIVVTDCLNEGMKAIMLVSGDRLVEKVASYGDERRYQELLQAVADNTDLILEGYRG